MEIRAASGTGEDTRAGVVETPAGLAQLFGGAGLTNPGPLLRVVVILMVGLLIFILDRVTGSSISFRALYTIPVALSVWWFGWRWGALVAILATAALVGSDAQDGFLVSRPIFVLSDALTRGLSYVLLVCVLQRQHRTQQRLAEASRVDALTGLLNRRGFVELTRRELERARRSQSGLALVYLDLDGFKGVNDKHGHAMGDAVLRAVGEVLGDSRATDVAGRIGGDEFVVLLSDASFAGAATCAERLHSELTACLRSISPGVTVSLGLVRATSPDVTTVDELLDRGDRAMYAAKRAGKNRVFREVA